MQRRRCPEDRAGELRDHYNKDRRKKIFNFVLVLFKREVNTVDSGQKQQIAEIDKEFEIYNPGDFIKSQCKELVHNYSVLIMLEE